MLSEKFQTNPINDNKQTDFNRVFFILQPIQLGVNAVVYRQNDGAITIVYKNLIFITTKGMKFVVCVCVSVTREREKREMREERERERERESQDCDGKR